MLSVKSVEPDRSGWGSLSLLTPHFWWWSDSPELVITPNISIILCSSNNWPPIICWENWSRLIQLFTLLLWREILISSLTANTSPLSSGARGLRSSLTWCQSSSSTSLVQPENIYLIGSLSQDQSTLYTTYCPRLDMNIMLYIEMSVVVVMILTTWVIISSEDH